LLEKTYIDSNDVFNVLELLPVTSHTLVTLPLHVTLVMPLIMSLMFSSKRSNAFEFIGNGLISSLPLIPRSASIPKNEAMFPKVELSQKELV
jgi:hypothetical protein